MLYPLSHALAPPCLLAARLSIISSHLIDRRLDRLLPALRHGWAGREAGSIGALCLLGFILRSVPISADVDSRFIPFPSSAVSSLGLFVLSARLRGRWCSHLIILDVLRCPACLPVVSSLVSSIIPSVGSVLRLSPRLATRWAGRLTDAVRLFVSRSILPLLACLGLFLAIHLIRMAATVCGLSARRALLACLVVSVPPLVARLFPFMGRSIGAALCRRHDVVGMGSGGHDMLCIIPFSPIVCGCLRRAG